MDIKKICVLGVGYIGLPVSCVLAKQGYSVVGVDVKHDVVDKLNRGEVHIEEPDLNELFKEVVATGRFYAATQPEPADVFMIAVPTPVKPDKTAEMKYVKSAAEDILPYLKSGNLVVLESTSPPGTVVDLLCPILQRSGLKLGEELYIAHSPERVLPGSIIKELVDNDRIIGGYNEVSAQKVSEFYKTFVKGEVFTTDSTTAELAKITENTFRDVNIAFANELAKVCEQLHVNFWELRNFANMHPRVNVHLAGPGVGGHCIALDPWFIVEKVPETARLICLARNINDSMPEFTFNKAMDIIKDVQAPKKVAVFGITYKPNIDDKRESPILKLIDMFTAAGIEVAVADCHVKERESIKNDIYEAAKGAHIAILAVNHREYTSPDFERLKDVMALPNVFDTRNIWQRSDVLSAGLNYYLLGDGSTDGEAAN